VTTIGRAVASDTADALAMGGVGVGRELVLAAETLARDVGIHELYLLTETAGDWFAGLGYEAVPREDARMAVGDSVEFTMSCATTGVPMRRTLARVTTAE
jgi:N-acetylglutamate synthase-like GNAT family acetyltransferase